MGIFHCEMKSIFIFILLITIAKFSFAQFFYVDVYRNNKIEPYPTLTFYDSLGNKLAIWEGKNQPKPRFKIYDIKPGTYSIRILSIGENPCENIDSTFENVKLNYDSLFSFHLNIQRHCKYDSSINNKTCPICHKSKKVIPIIYGLLIQINQKQSNDGKKYLSAGCKLTCCNPHWYCKKDKLKF
jgi:hypothetical protein